MVEELVAETGAKVVEMALAVAVLAEVETAEVALAIPPHNKTE